MPLNELTARQALDRLSSLRQRQRDGRRSPHKPLLVLLALARLAAKGSSALPWSLDRDVPDDDVGPLREGVTGRLEASLEEALRSRPDPLDEAARGLVESHFPSTVGPDVLVAVGLDPEVLERGSPSGGSPELRRRSRNWPAAVIEAWDRQCAFCGFDGAAGGNAAGIDAAHVRCFKLGGPDELDNGMALCSLHHKLFDRGMLGLDGDHAVVVSQRFSARTPVGRMVYELHRQPLRPRRGTPLPAEQHVVWHRNQVFQGSALASR